jgi:16S rRNA (guanine1516-N2)-methyltransferase
VQKMRLKDTRLGFAFFMHNNDSNDLPAHQEDADDAVPMGKALRCDFVGGAVQHRLRFGGGRRQDLPKAVGFKPGINPHIIDATAGLGRDAFLLASLGATVTMIERSADMHALLLDGMARALDAGGVTAEIISRMTLIHGDAIQLLPSLSPEIVFVDPMHPPRNKSALVKAEMRQIRAIVGIDDDQTRLMQTALAHASRRVVLKWPAKAVPMVDIPSASHQIIGKSVCYDVFMRP